MKTQVTTPPKSFENTSKVNETPSINPEFDLDNLSLKEVESHLNGFQQSNIEHAQHGEIFIKLLGQVIPVNFRELLNLSPDEKPTKTQFRIKVIEYVLALAKKNNWGICRNHDFIYLYNGAYWSLIDSNELQSFLGEVAEKMGIKWDYAQDYKFREELFRQFMAVSNLPTPRPNADQTKLNFLNGTLIITASKTELTKPKSKDFLTYILPFNYDPSATAPQFFNYLNKVQPDIERQNILSEYLAYVFINSSVLKLEKCLLLYGTGANGKSVFFEIVNALLGPENVSSYSLQSLTNENGYFRAKIANKLVNYASEINGKLETDVFKRLASGEPVEARLPYGEPFTMSHYAKLIFNCNELPKDVEHTTAYFRRFLIILFDVTIPEIEQDKELSSKIIQTELSGVFNWVMEGLTRLLKQKKFTDSDAAQKQIEEYRRTSDSVQMFLEEEGYEKSVDQHKPMKELFIAYRTYCNENGNYPCSSKNFGERLKNAGYTIDRKNFGMAVFVEKNLF